MVILIKPSFLCPSACSSLLECALVGGGILLGAAIVDADDVDGWLLSCVIAGVIVGFVSVLLLLIVTGDVWLCGWLICEFVWLVFDVDDGNGVLVANGLSGVVIALMFRGVWLSSESLTPPRCLYVPSFSFSISSFVSVLLILRL